VNKNLLIIAGASLLVATVAVLLIVLPSRDICSDDVRGYERTASSSLEAAREDFSKIRGSVSAEERQKVPVQLDGLSATNFAALKACDTQCKLLDRCLRFVLMKPPSEACPTEYADYKSRTESALKFLDDLKKVEMGAKQAVQKAGALDQARQDVAKLENSPSSTGGRLAVLKARVDQIQQDLSQDLAGLNRQIDSIVQ